MDKVIDFLTQKEFLGNAVWKWAGLLVCVFLGLAVGRVVRFLLERASTRRERNGKDPLLTLAFRCIRKPVAMLCFVAGLNVGLSILSLQGSAADIATGAIKVLYAIAVGYAIYRLVDILDFYLSRWAAKTESKLDDMLVPMVRRSVRITVVIIVAIFVLNSVSSPGQVATLLTGLGVGGLAVALAAQDTIKNFFGSVMILLDKPFQIGDRVILGGHDGPVEEVGFRTTKIRRLDGHLVTVPNSTVVSEMVENIGKRPFIKRVANITITYDTPPEKVRRAVAILHEILDNHDGMNPDLPPRVFFSDFNDWALNILMIYWYHPPEYWDYMAFTQKVNMRILDRFNEEGIDFAFPSQTVYLANDEKRQLALRLLNQKTGADVA